MFGKWTERPAVGRTIERIGAPLPAKLTEVLASASSVGDQAAGITLFNPAANALRLYRYELSGTHSRLCFRPAIGKGIGKHGFRVLETPRSPISSK